MTADQIPKKNHASQNRKNPEPDPQWIKERFSYCPETGKVFSRKTGNEQKKINRRGYLLLRTTIKKYNKDGTKTSKQIELQCHRVAFAIMEGRWPNLIGHTDDNKKNNKWKNLKEITCSKNVLDGLKNHNYKIGEQIIKRWKYWKVTKGHSNSETFSKYCKAWQFLQEMNAWREAGRQGPAPTRKRDRRAGVQKN